MMCLKHIKKLLMILKKMKMMKNNLELSN